MENNTTDHDLSAAISALKQRFGKDGQSINCHLEGLFHSQYTNYWDYINLDLLLNLQQPKTSFPDEIIFITYHQICELYFKLILGEMEKISRIKTRNTAAFISGITRINRYYEQLIASFSIMTEGMELQQFSKFRMTLFPASGFQSVQYRLIEINATDLVNLTKADSRKEFTAAHKLPEIFSNIYWSKGAVTNDGAKKDLSAVFFEEKYSGMLLAKARSVKQKNLWQIFNKYFADMPDNAVLITQLRKLDYLANVEWSLVHYRAAAKHLQKAGKVATGTGGTNWRKYLPPSFQKVIFFPDLWTVAEKEKWGTAKQFTTTP